MPSDYPTKAFHKMVDKFCAPRVASDESVPPPADKPPGSGEIPAPETASDHGDSSVNTLVNPCKCIDCGGTEPSHSADCTYMAAFAKDFSVQDTLNERGSRYGDFTDNATISQALKDVLNQADGFHTRCSDVQREALEMIAQKIARILNGDPNYRDNWHDIQGYAKLAEERCKEER